MSEPTLSKPPQIAETVAALTDAHQAVRSEAEQAAAQAAQSREDRLEALNHALEAPEA